VDDGLVDLPLLHAKGIVSAIGDADYGKDDVTVLGTAVSMSGERHPGSRNIWRWPERNGYNVQLVIVLT
jgi:hypothetical protein